MFVFGLMRFSFFVRLFVLRVLIGIGSRVGSFGNFLEGFLGLFFGTLLRLGRGVMKGYFYL